MKKTSILLLSLCLAFSACKKDGKAPGLNGGGNNPLAKVLGGPASISSGCSMPATTITKNIQADFGAAGNGVTDDSQAFLEAAFWINNNASGSVTLKLYIPTGVYRVGVQLAPGGTFSYPSGVLSNPTGGASLRGFDMLALSNVQNVVIYGDGPNASVIKYHDNLAFGGMAPGGAPCNNASACNTCGNTQYYASIGDFLSLDDCTCIDVNNLKLDGNAQMIQLKGVKGDCNGYQATHDGIYILDGGDISISDVTCANFGRDGLMTHATNPSSQPTNITLTNLICDANCRQGFSFTGGSYLTATGCEFNNTGTIFYSNPGCGMDIEPENGATCDNATFTNCKFLDNKFCGMISDGYGPAVNTIAFLACEFSASYPGSWSIWPEKMSNTIFLGCIIRGQFTHVSGLSGTDMLVVSSSTITDWNGSFSTPVSGWNNYLMNFGANAPSNHYYWFGGNIFEVHHSYLIYTVPSGDPITSTYYTSRNFEGNTFTFDYDDLNATTPGTAIPQLYLGKFLNCYMTSNKFFEVSPPSTNSGGIYWLGIYDSTSTNANARNYTMGNNTFSPQDGLGSPTLYTRVRRNPNWLAGNAGSLANF